VAIRLFSQKINQQDLNWFSIAIITVIIYCRYLLFFCSSSFLPLLFSYDHTSSLLFTVLFPFSRRTIILLLFSLQSSFPSLLLRSYFFSSLYSPLSLLSSYDHTSSLLLTVLFLFFLRFLIIIIIIIITAAFINIFFFSSSSFCS
jgi:hypothetical protein